MTLPKLLGRGNRARGPLGAIRCSQGLRCIYKRRIFAFDSHLRQGGASKTAGGNGGSVGYALHRGIRAPRDALGTLGSLRLAGIVLHRV